MHSYMTPGSQLSESAAKRSHSYHQLTTPTTPPLPNSSPPSQFFPQFTRLPPELRREIWFFSLPRRRLIEITYDEESRSFESRQPPPILLSVCAESRYAALDHFTLAFRDKHGTMSIPFDLECDILYMRPVSFTTATFGWTKPGAPYAAIKAYLDGIGEDILPRINCLAMDPLMYNALYLSPSSVSIDDRALTARFHALKELYSATYLGVYGNYDGEIEEKREDDVRAVVSQIFVGRYQASERPWRQLTTILDQQTVDAPRYGLAGVDIKGLLMTDKLRIEWNVVCSPDKKQIE